MKITAQDLLRLGVVDAIVPEPTGGAHRDPTATIAATGQAIEAAFADLRGLDAATVVRLRREKFMAIGRALG
jgi:acetyl-CoA carboxylase carboxyl transferase subunit alpha